MSRKALFVAIAAACALAVAAAPARASSTLALALTPDLSAPVSCPDDALFGFALHESSLGGRALGDGQTCVLAVDGCEEFVPFCRRVVHATLTLGLPRGSLTVPTRLTEVLPTVSSFIQAGHGTVAGGTGAYAHVTGRLDGGGYGAFDDDFVFSGRLVYLAELRGVR
jgi:hypothetical protein